MRVIVALQEHFSKTPDSSVYSHTVFDYAFWSRYLGVFEEVTVFARLDQRPEVPAAWLPLKASGKGVKFVGLPDFLGPWQFFKHQGNMKALARQILQAPDACILRVPGPIGTLLWHELHKQNRPYGLEVVGDPYDAFAPGGVKSILRPILRIKLTRDLIRQCRGAAVASYVTEYSLQKRYPPGAWNTHYSSIELPPQALVDDARVQQRLETIDRKSHSSEPWQICYAGTMNQLYKAPDVLIDAVGQCVKKGMNLRLTLMGEGQFRSKLEARVTELGIDNKVTFTGLLSAGPAVYEQLDKADLYVLPSRQEGLPRSMIEAMARALPGIGSKVGGFPELLDDRHMVKPDDVQDLADTIEKVLTDIEGLKQSVRENVKIAAKYRADILQARRTEFYSKVKDSTYQWLAQAGK